MAGPGEKAMPGPDVGTLPRLIGAPGAFWPLLRPQPSPAVAGLSPTRPASPDAVVSDGAAVPPVLAAVVSAGADVAAAAVVAVAAAVVPGAALAGAAVLAELLSSLPHATRSIAPTAAAAMNRRAIYSPLIGCEVTVVIARRPVATANTSRDDGHHSA